MHEPEEQTDFINALSATDKIVVVEGRKDRKALEGIGVKKIFCIDKKPLYKVAEEVAEKCKEAILLTDLDREGRKLYGKLKEMLSNLGVEIDNKFREYLFRETKIRQIEGLCRLNPCNPRHAVAAESPAPMKLKKG